MRAPFDPETNMALGKTKLRLLALAVLALSFTAQAKRDEPARLELQQPQSSPRPGVR